MTQEKNNKYTVIKPELNTNFYSFYKLFIEKRTSFKNDHLILDLSKIEVKLEELIKFKEFSEEKIESGTSFVVINTTVNLDEIPDEIIVVPTFQEAIDMIEMDEMTRSLDF